MAVLAAQCILLVAPHGVSAAPRGVSSALRGVPAAPHCMLALQDTHGNFRGPEEPLGGEGTKHEKIIWSRIA